MKRDIIDYLGNKIGEMELPDETPEEVWSAKLAKYAAAPERSFPPLTPRQIRLALLSQGITPEMVNTALDSLPEPMKSQAKITWEYSTQYERTNPLVDSVAQLLTWTTEQVDELWAQASSI